MVHYVRGSPEDRWHWCQNCTQYPMVVYEKTSLRPSAELCEQCKTKEDNGNCQCEVSSTMEELGLKNEIPAQCDAWLEA